MGKQQILHGLDLVDCQRIENILQNHKRRFLQRVFTPLEQEYCRRYKNCAERFAGRFAVKEAVLKLLGTGWRGKIGFTDIETCNDASGKPYVKLTGETAMIAARLGIRELNVSITHARGLAIASVIALADRGPDTDCPCDS